jgi:heterotetrameric sarcosine oxidase gamma subunit
MHEVGPASLLPDRDELAIVERTGLALLRVQAVPGAGDPVELGAVIADGARVQTLAPGDWLVIGESGPAETLAQRIGKRGCVVTDMSAGWVVLELRGSRAYAALRSECGLDFESWARAGGRCVRTRLARLAVLIEQLEPDRCWRIFCERPTARWLHDWLLHAAGAGRSGKQ